MRARIAAAALKLQCLLLLCEMNPPICVHLLCSGRMKLIICKATFAHSSLLFSPLILIVIIIIAVVVPFLLLLLLCNNEYEKKKTFVVCKKCPTHGTSSCSCFSFLSCCSSSPWAEKTTNICLWEWPSSTTF